MQKMQSLFFFFLLVTCAVVFWCVCLALCIRIFLCFFFIIISLFGTALCDFCCLDDHSLLCLWRWRLVPNISDSSLCVSCFPHPQSPSSMGSFSVKTHTNPSINTTSLNCTGEPSRNKMTFSGQQRLIEQTEAEMQLRGRMTPLSPL